MYPGLCVHYMLVVLSAWHIPCWWVPCIYLRLLLWKKSELSCPLIPRINVCCHITCFFVHVIPIFSCGASWDPHEGFCLDISICRRLGFFSKLPPSCGSQCFSVFPCFRNIGFLLFKYEFIYGCNEVSWLVEKVPLLFCTATLIFLGNAFLLNWAPMIYIARLVFGSL